MTATRKVTLLGGPYDGDEIETDQVTVLLGAYYGADGLLHRDRPGIFTTVAYAPEDNTDGRVYDFDGPQMTGGVFLHGGWEGDPPPTDQHVMLATDCRLSLATPSVKLDTVHCTVCADPFATIADAIGQPETPEAVALLTGAAEEIIDAIVDGPQHEHRRSPGGLTLACHPGCPLWEPEVKPVVMRGDQGDARLQLIAAGEFAVALAEQAELDDLREQIDGLRVQANEHYHRIEDSLAAISQTRFSLHECRDVLTVIAHHRGAKVIDTASGPVRRLPERLLTMLDQEVKDWPRQRDAERMDAQNAAADAKEGE